MFGEDFSHQRNPLLVRDLGQPDDTGMGKGADKDELSKVLIGCDQHAALSLRPLQNGFVSRVRAHLSGLYRVVAIRAEPFRQRPARTAVDQESHRAGARPRGDRESEALA
jgi:hypothetical protein